MRKYPPAIPDQSPVCEIRFFELNERVTVFDGLTPEELMRRSRGHFFKAPLQGQTSLFGGLNGR